jgi:uncharacterized protein YcfL
MRISWVILLALALVGCSSTRQTPIPSTALTSLQATTLAMQLANDKALATYSCHPFKKQEPILFLEGRWIWIGREGYGQGDIEAKVELAANGSTNNVVLRRLANQMYPLKGF